MASTLNAKMNVVHSSSASAFMGKRAPVPVAKTYRRQAKPSLQVNMQLSLVDKQKTVDKVKTALEESLVVAGFTYQGLSVKDVTAFRRELPEDATFMIMKNTMMKRAVKDTSMEAFGDVLTGPNGFLLVGEDGVKGTFKAANKLIKDYNTEHKEDGKEIHFIGGAMEGKLLQPEEMSKLEDLPTKADLMTKIAMILKNGPQSVGMTINAMPTKVGMSVAAYREKLEAEESA